MIKVIIELEDEDQLLWLREAATESEKKFNRQFMGKAGTGVTRNRAGRYELFMHRVVQACDEACERIKNGQV